MAAATLTSKLYSLLFRRPPPSPSPSSWASCSSSAPSIKARTLSTTTSTRGSCGNTSSTSMRTSSSLEAPIQARRTRSTQQLFAQSWSLSLKMMLKVLFMDHHSLLARNGFTYKTDSLPSAVFEVCLVSMLRK
uniref:HSPC051 n=2 Tax=Homo sapiens TaxID=9606 RepID=Q9NZY4_HUMAN|nr:HSPC051 [Homo sapiens]